MDKNKTLESITSDEFNKKIGGKVVEKENSEGYLLRTYIENEKFDISYSEYGENINELGYHNNFIEENNIPKYIFQLTNLEILGLFNVNNIPKEIKNLHKLEELYLSSCFNITKLPLEILHLKKLKKLWLSDTGITTLPKEIEELKQLQILYIDDNQITTLPKEIGELKNLTNLYLKSIRLNSLPKEIGKLTNLTELDLLHTNITYLEKDYIYYLLQSNGNTNFTPIFEDEIKQIITNKMSLEDTINLMQADKSISLAEEIAKNYYGELLISKDNKLITKLEQIPLVKESIIKLFPNIAQKYYEDEITMRIGAIHPLMI